MTRLLWCLVLAFATIGMSGCPATQPRTSVKTRTQVQPEPPPVRKRNEPPDGNTRSELQQLKLLLRLSQNQPSMTPAEKERKAEYRFRIAGAYYNIWMKKRRVLRWCQKNPDKQCPSKPFLARVYGRSATRNFERVWKEFPLFSKRKQVRALLIQCYRLQGRSGDAKKLQTAK